MDGAGLMARGGHCLTNETHPDGERCCLNLGHHNNIAAGAGESAEGGWEGSGKGGGGGVRPNVLPV